MSFILPDLQRILIVLVFLGTLLILRQIVIAKATSLKQTLGTDIQRIQLLEVYRVEKSLKLSLLDIEGNRVAVLHGAGRQTALLKLDTVSTEKRVSDA